MRYVGDRKPAVYQDEGRYTSELSAVMHISGADSLPVTLVNFSRHGFRVTLSQALSLGQIIWLEVDGWPRLMASVIWSEDQRAGCMFDVPPDTKTFALMCTSASGLDRVI